MTSKRSLDSRRTGFAVLVILATTVLANSQTETVIHTFQGADGMSPAGGLIADASGHLYGTVGSGGAYGFGKVYSLDSSGHETVLYSFAGGADGSSPFYGVIRDASGNLYGTASLGGVGEALGNGVVFRLDASGNETVLYSFTGGADGGFPSSGVIRDESENLYGATNYGGAGFGVVYKLDSSGIQTVLYSFPEGPSGYVYPSGVVRDEAGNLYGTTEYGGTADEGMVFKVDPAGRLTTLHDFSGLSDGGLPLGNVIRDGNGSLYGATNYGGVYRLGVIYKLDTNGNETVLHSFGSGMDGKDANTRPIFDTRGNLYGGTNSGGSFDKGTIYKIDHITHAESVLLNFSGYNGGPHVNSPFLLINGNLYGTTGYGGNANEGVVFKLSLP